jgi:hypothetical protein
MSILIPIDGRPDRGGFAEGDDAALAWDVLKYAGSHQDVDVIDMSNCVHLKPYALACLCALAAENREAGRPVTAVPPKQSDCAEHFKRLGLPSFFNGPWQSDQPRESNLPISIVDWPPGDSGDQILELLAPRTELATGVRADLVGSLDEVILNALTHSGWPVGCVVAGQAFDGTGKVEIAVVDLGRTIRGHLASNPRYSELKTDEAAILKALEDGVTGTPDGQRNSRGDPNSGAGLAYVRAYCASGMGELTVLSGDRWITCTSDGTVVIGRLFTRFKGCLINLRFLTG